ncbi:hypothetical protein OXX59_004724 [Metschnikowia pulcherrima]
MIGLPLDDIPPRKKQYGAIGGAIAIVLMVLFGTNLFAILKIYMVPVSDKGICTIWDIQRPVSYEKNDSSVNTILHSGEFRNSSAKVLSGMIQVDTQVFDDPPAVDASPEYWAKFEKFHEYLEKTFPAVYEKFEVTRVNTYGLVYVLKGSDSSLKPVMLTGHQDVVPVQKDTLGDWTYPPFSGHYDGDYVYGRGAADCKNTVSAIMEALELLCQEAFQPARTVVVALGMDEEVSGFHGARFIGQYLQERFGRDSFYAIIDEGFGLTKDETTGRIIAMPGTGEKGYLDVWAEIITPGGHSSIPPDHTSIGIMGELQMLIEKDQWAPIFSPKNPTFDYMQCLAKHAGNAMSTKLRKSILRAGYDKLANSYVAKALTSIKESKYLIQTSQSMDIIVGGEKANALPESVKLLTNHRIAIESNVQEVFDHFVARVLEVAKRHGLGVKVGNSTLIKSSGSGEFVIRDAGKSLEVAPRTPVDDNVWKNLAGVTRHIYEDLVFSDMKDPVIVAPAIMTGNTDTRHYWNLTKNIYRYTPFYSTSYTAEYKIHSVDEKMSMDNHLRVVAFFYEYLQVVDSKAADNE